MLVVVPVAVAAEAGGKVKCEEGKDAPIPPAALRFCHGEL